MSKSKMPASAGSSRNGSGGEYRPPPLSRTAVRALVRDAKDVELALMIMFAGVMGVRSGEMEVLLEGDVDLDKEVLRIVHGSHYREVPIPPFVMKALRSRSKSTVVRPADYLFSQKALNRSRTHKEFRKLCDRIRERTGNVEWSRTRWTDLRIFAIRNWFRAGMTLPQIRALAGYSGMRTPMRWLLS